MVSEIMALLMVGMTILVCAAVDSDININIPCVVFEDRIYQANLEYIKHPLEEGRPMWKLKTTNINQTGLNNSFCSTVDEHINLTINCVRVDNTDYKVKLNYYHNSQYSHLKYWELGDFTAL